MSSHITVTILGSGTSHGVPMIGCDCPVCQSTDPRDNRTRCSALIQTPEASILIDTSPDLRQQALREKLIRVDAVLLTHAHADHIMGFDDLRRFCDLLTHNLPVYGSAQTMEAVKQIFPYGFSPATRILGYVAVDGYVIDTSSFTIGGLLITPLPVLHGRMLNTAYLFSRNGRKLFAYVTDCNFISDEIFELIRNVEVLVIDGVRERSHTTHFNVKEAIQAAQKIAPQMAYLTHQAHDKSHAQRTAEMPPGISVAYDGMKITFPW